MKSQPSREVGYTLVEMLVVLVLLGMAAAASLPYATMSSRSQKLEATATQLASLLRVAQTLSFISNESVSVTFDRDSSTWLVSKSNARLHLDRSIAVTALTVEGQINEQQFGYRFFPTGGNSGGQIVLGIDDEEVAINLNWLTGTITSSRAGRK